MANELDKMTDQAKNVVVGLSLTGTVLPLFGKTIQSVMEKQQALGDALVTLKSDTDAAAGSLKILDIYSKQLTLTLEKLNQQLLGLSSTAQLSAPDAKAGKMLASVTAPASFPVPVTMMGTSIGLAAQEERKRNPGSEAPEKIEKFQKNFDNLGTAIGTKLLPLLSGTLTLINPVIQGIGEWVSNSRIIAPLLINLAGILTVAYYSYKGFSKLGSLFKKKPASEGCCCCSQKQNGLLSAISPKKSKFQSDPLAQGEFRELLGKDKNQGWFSKIKGTLSSTIKKPWKKNREDFSNTTEEPRLENIGDALVSTKNEKAPPPYRTWSGSRKNPRKTRRKNQRTPDTSHTPPNQGEIGDTTQKVRARSRNNPAIKSIVKSQTPPMMGFAGSSNQYFQQTANDANKLGLILNGPLTNSVSRSNNVFSVLGATMRRIPLFMVFDAIQQLWPAIEGIAEVVGLCWNGSWDEAISKLAEVGGMIIDFMDGTILGTVYTGFAKLWNFFGGSLPETIGEATKPWLESKMIKGAPDQNSDAGATNEPTSAIGSTMSESARNDAPTKPSITEMPDIVPQPQHPPAQHSAGRQADGSANGVVVNFSPTIHIQGTLLDKIQQEVMQALRLKEPELEQTMNRIFAQQSRRSYA